MEGAGFQDLGLQKAGAYGLRRNEQACDAGHRKDASKLRAREWYEACEIRRRGIPIETLTAHRQRNEWTKDTLMGKREACPARMGEGQYM